MLRLFFVLYAVASIGMLAYVAVVDPIFVRALDPRAQGVGVLGLQAIGSAVLSITFLFALERKEAGGLLEQLVYLAGVGLVAGPLVVLGVDAYFF